MTRQDVVKVRFTAGAGPAPPIAEVRPTVRALDKPVFAYTYQIVDNRPGNGDGQITRGEGATVYLTVENVGKGRSFETQANVRNLTGDGLLLRAGRFDVSNMLPGDKREVAFTFDVLDNLDENMVKLDLSVGDRDLGVVSSERLSVPVAKRGMLITEARERVSLNEATNVLVQPVKEARVVGKLAAGSIVDQVGKLGDFAKVLLAPNRFGFVAASVLGAAPAGRAARLDFDPLLAHSPPILEVAPAKLATTGNKVRIEGVVTDADQVLDAYIFVGPRKVFYQSNRKSSDPTKMPFSVDVDLSPGINVIHVVARENETTASRRTMVVRRDGPRGEALPTPKAGLLGTDWDFNGSR